MTMGKDHIKEFKMKLLHIIANPKKEGSASVTVSTKLVEKFVKNNPKCEVETLNLYDQNINHLSLDSLTGKDSKMFRLDKFHFE